MVYLILSIVCNTAVYLIFKQFERKGVQLLPAIAINYLTALTIGLLVVPDLSYALQDAAQFPLWLVGGLLLGFAFISVFYLMALTAQRVGVSVTTIASKMSLVLAMILFIFIRPEERLTIWKVLAIAFAIAGVILSSAKEGGAKFPIKQFGWPIVILLGSTVVDFGIAYFSEYPKNESERALFSCLSFGMAAVCGVIIALVQVFRGRLHIQRKDVIGGVALGIINYGSIYFLVCSYHSQLLPTSSLLPVNNLCVVLLGTIAAVLIFRERLTKTNIIGVVLSIFAIALIILGIEK